MSEELEIIKQALHITWPYKNGIFSYYDKYCYIDNKKYIMNKIKIILIHKLKLLKNSLYSSKVKTIITYYCDTPSNLLLKTTQDYHIWTGYRAYNIDY